MITLNWQNQQDRIPPYKSLNSKRKSVLIELLKIQSVICGQTWFGNSIRLGIIFQVRKDAPKSSQNKEEPKEEKVNKKLDEIKEENAISKENKEEKTKEATVKESGDKKETKETEDKKKVQAKANENNNPLEYEDEEEKEIDNITALIETVKQFKLR